MHCSFFLGGVSRCAWYAWVLKMASEMSIEFSFNGDVS
jgi:hypothetical protein